MGNGVDDDLQACLAARLVGGLAIELLVQVCNKAYFHLLQLVSELPDVGTCEIVRVLTFRQHDAAYIYASVKQHWYLRDGSMYASFIIVIHKSDILSERA